MAFQSEEAAFIHLFIHSNNYRAYCVPVSGLWRWSSEQRVNSVPSWGD